MRQVGKHLRKGKQIWHFYTETPGKRKEVGFQLWRRWEEDGLNANINSNREKNNCVNVAVQSCLRFFVPGERKTDQTHRLLTAEVASSDVERTNQ